MKTKQQPRKIRVIAESKVFSIDTTITEGKCLKFLTGLRKSFEHLYRLQLRKNQGFTDNLKVTTAAL